MTAYGTKSIFRSGAGANKGSPDDHNDSLPCGSGLIHSSIDVLCKKAGISKTFFYSFFPSKEELVLQALRYQQPKLLRYAQQLMDMNLAGENV